MAGLPGQGESILPRRTIRADGQPLMSHGSVSNRDVFLDPETYYVSRVAIQLNLWHIVALNAGTLVLCVLALLLPAMIITRITPVKAIRFD